MQTSTAIFFHNFNPSIEKNTFLQPFIDRGLRSYGFDHDNHCIYMVYYTLEQAEATYAEYNHKIYYGWRATVKFYINKKN